MKGFGQTAFGQAFQRVAGGFGLTDIRTKRFFSTDAGGEFGQQGGVDFGMHGVGEGYRRVK